ncbi:MULTISPECIES: ribokinase [unclassified Leifsonia]|uniref:ribokinase n=1 Tax=unclassified Leifsonia TaxID=2663824 RepID=UPI00092AD685|nr:ribokinase [Leifsonia sp. 71-9]OJX75314.1 MAG: ribokinase [Leifsonia sp. 71-9]
MHDPRSLVVVGSINVDVTAIADRLPTPGETIGGGVLQRHAGGKGANQAAAASRLGARVRMVGAVGDDADGGWMLDELREAGVDVTAVRRVATATGTALIAVDHDGENQIVVCPGANAEVSLADVEIGDEEVVLTQLEVDLQVVLDLAAGTRAFLAVNAAPARPLPAELIDRVELFIVNESEYALMPELAGAARVAVTYGGDGAALYERGTEVARVPAVRVRPVNTVGAGDAFCAALTIALTSGATDEEALRAACAVGAAAVAHPGSQPPFAPLASYAA